MPTNLTPEMRLKVAEACGASSLHEWMPAAYGYDRFALLRTVAQRIADKQLRIDRENPDEYIPPIEEWQVLGLAIAANNVNALETLCAELISHE